LSAPADAAAAPPPGARTRPDRPVSPRDPFRSLLALTRRQGDVARYRSGGEQGFLVSGPEYIRHVLAENSGNYTKATSVNVNFKWAVADGLLTSEGAVWRWHRRLMQPAFHRDRLLGLGGQIVDATLEMLERWPARVEGGTPLEVAGEMGLLTLRIATRALFGHDLGEEADALGEEIARGLPAMASPTSRDLVPGAAHLRALATAIIDRRRARPGESEDLLSLLLGARDPDTGRPLSDDQLADEMITLLLAGHGTTANALAWTWTLLSERPDAARALGLELEEVLGPRPPDLADLAALPYTRAVIQESMRLYPPAWIMGRRAVGEDALGEHVIPAGSVVAICPYTMHRDPRFWTHPDRFDPARFMAEDTRPFVYFPFGGGPRVCIGQHLAMIELQLIVATVARRWALRLPDAHPVVPDRRFVLRPRGGLPMYPRPIGPRLRAPA